MPGKMSLCCENSGSVPSGQSHCKLMFDQCVPLFSIAKSVKMTRGYFIAQIGYTIYHIFRNSLKIKVLLESLAGRLVPNLASFVL